MTVEQMAKHLKVDGTKVYTLISAGKLKKRRGRIMRTNGLVTKGLLVWKTGAKTGTLPTKDEQSADSNGHAKLIARPRRGRPRGSYDQSVAERKRKMLEAWDRQDFGDNKAATGRAFEFCKQDATNYINEHIRSADRKR
jgi:hypothetical protein